MHQASQDAYRQLVQLVTIPPSAVATRCEMNPFLMTCYRLYSLCFLRNISVLHNKPLLSIVFAPSAFIRLTCSRLSPRVQWYRPLWTHLCHCSLHPWWPPSHSRWVTSRWAVQERWENTAWDQKRVHTLYLFEKNIFKSASLNCKMCRSHICSLHGSLFFVLQFMAANTAMQGAYIPQYAHMQTTSVPVEVRVLT